MGERERDDQRPRLESARFLLSAPTPERLPADHGAEVAFAGRSNAGKSTALNALCRQRALARTSKTPGRTQMLNCFAVGGRLRLIDLPGYGYARVPEALRRSWGPILARYFATRRSLAGLVLLADIRHGPRPMDFDLLAHAAGRLLPVLVLLSKSDKLPQGARLQAARRYGEQVSAASHDSRTMAFSALDGTGVEATRAIVATWLAAHAAKCDAPPGEGQSTDP